MEALGMSMACAQPKMQNSHASQFSRGPGQMFSNGRQKRQHRLLARALQREKSTSLNAVPWCSPTNEQNCLLGSSASRMEQLPAERSSLSRLDVELMLRRMVRADKEPSEKDTEDEPDKTNDSDHQLWINRARNIKTTAQIFCSMMFWTMLFFVSTIMDGGNGGGWNRKSNRRRRK